MTVLLVLATFIVFLTIDYFYSKRHILQVADQPELRPTMARPRPQPVPSVVSGFLVPEHLRYHPGHTWALSEGPKLVRAGLDDFAARLVGKLEKVTLPQRGQWVRQGQKIATLHRNGVAADLVSPVEGVVTEINEDVVKDPEVMRRDPYGDGWLVAVESPDAKLNFRNLLSGDIARWWMEEAATRLRKHLPVATGALAQDGGVAIYDLTTYLQDDDWTQVTREFFLG